MAVILHVDMDAFFASVELLSHPEWRGKPLVVGAGPHERGVVSTCSYEARKYGIRSAMPSRTAYQLCPHAIFTYPHMREYQEVSDRAFEVFSHYTPYVEGVSVDEAFLDVTGSLHLFRGESAADRAVALGESLRAEIRRACGVTCSVGLAPNRLLAKIGSEIHKPDGLTLMPFEPSEIAAFLVDRPITTLWGVGKKTVEALKPYGITTCGDLQRLGRGNALVPDELVDMAFGVSDDKVYWEPAEEKSVSREHTFDEDVSDREAVRAKLLELVSDVGLRFRRETRWARTARLKLRDADFETSTRQMPFNTPARDDIAFRATALALFDREWPERPSARQGRGRRTVRLVGFGVTNFQDAPGASAPTLFGDPDEESRKKRERLSEALDALRDRGLIT
jgi:DNA polymerase-4